jgi:hypothetical protein
MERVKVRGAEVTLLGVVRVVVVTGMGEEVRVRSDSALARRLLGHQQEPT